MKNDTLSSFDKMALDRENLVKSIIESIDNGAPLWRKPWSEASADSIVQSNLKTLSVYSGINAVRLYLESIMNGYSEGKWASFLQIKEKGWQLQKGAKGVPIFKWTEYDKLEKKVPDWEKINKMQSDKRLEYITKNVYAGMSFSGYVFNIDKIDGVERGEKRVLSPAEIKQFQDKENCDIEKIISSCDIPITHDGRGRAFYSLYEDAIKLPIKESFDSRYDYYSTVLHEIAHSTGHPSRLARFQSGVKQNKAEYATEELRAELSSVFLSMACGRVIPVPEHENHTAYLASWSSALKNDYKIFYEAVKDAENISKYIIKNYLEAVPSASNAPSMSKQANEMFAGVPRKSMFEKNGAINSGAELEK